MEVDSLSFSVTEVFVRMVNEKLCKCSTNLFPLQRSFHAEFVRSKFTNNRSRLPSITPKTTYHVGQPFLLSSGKASGAVDTRGLLHDDAVPVLKAQVSRNGRLPPIYLERTYYYRMVKLDGIECANGALTGETVRAPFKMHGGMRRDHSPG